MSIKAKVGEIEFELDTVEDLMALLAAAKMGTSALPVASSPDRSESLKQRLKAAWNGMGKRQRGIIRALTQAPDGLTDGELCTNLGIGGNLALGGLMAAMNRAIKAEGLRPDQVILKTKAPSGRGQLYRLTPDMMELPFKSKNQ